MDAIGPQVLELAKDADDVGRSKIIMNLRDLQRAIETPMDSFFHIFNSHMQTAVIYVGVELGLFKELAKENAGSMTAIQLAEKTRASPQLLGSSDISLRLKYFSLDTYGPVAQALPSFLEENKYQDITDNRKTPFQRGHRTEQSAFEWLSQQPKLFGALQLLMGGLQSNDWIIGFDLLDQAAQAVTASQPGLSEKPFLVDVGGGHGHQCKQILDKYPSLKGRLILQDLSQAVDKLPPIDGVRIVAQNFFEKQVVEALKGATFYYLRRVMHDWPDASAAKILQHLKAAMNADSKILIDEVVLPEMNVHWHAAMADICMGFAFGGKERTRRQWEDLVEEAGLRLEQVHTYNISTYNSIVVLAVK
ncbi:MAG: hypothetical protein Q9191_004810 [Dirinaria sp. TL-2023a]